MGERGREGDREGERERKMEGGEKGQGDWELHTLRENQGAYCFAAAASLPLGLMPLFAISSPRFRIGIPSIYSITKTLLTKQRNT